jgi:hypothetical protein
MGEARKVVIETEVRAGIINTCASKCEYMYQRHDENGSTPWCRLFTKQLDVWRRTNSALMWPERLTECVKGEIKFAVPDNVSVKGPEGTTD